MIKVTKSINEVFYRLNVGKEIDLHLLTCAFMEILKNKNPEIRDVLLGGFLTSIMMKGPTVSEIVALIKTAFKIDNFSPSNAKKVKLPKGKLLIGVVGSGKKGVKTMNISTLSALIAASLGAYIAKPGSSSTSSITGSVDFMREVGANIDLHPTEMIKILLKTGFGFFSIESFIPRFDQVFHALHEILNFDPQTFDNTKLDEILSTVGNFEIFINQLKAYWEKKSYSVNGINFTPAYDTKKINDYKVSSSKSVVDCEKILAIIKNRVYKIEHNRLSSSLLEGVNFEINQDQTQLQNTITEFGFDRKLNDTISKINEKLYDAKDPFDFKNCIDLIRALLNELCISIALEIQNKKQISSSSPTDSMGRSRQYFIDNRVKFLSKEEDDFVGQFNAFISNAGVHALHSEREYARISRNLVIELGLFLVERLKKYLS